MLYERKQLPELEYMKHRHDSGFDYIKHDESILDNSTSSYLYKNNLMYSFLKKLQPLVSIIFDHYNIVRNMKNYIVDPYYYKHNS